MVMRRPQRGQTLHPLVTRIGGAHVHRRNSAERAFMSSIVWFRRDLRLADHSPLRAACESGGPVLPVFIWDPEDEEGAGHWGTGAASRVWLHHSLSALGAGLAARGSRLLIARGPTAQVLDELARASGATSLHFNRRVEPAARRLEAQVTARLGERLAVSAHGDAMLVAASRLATANGEPYRVFTPFWRRLREVFEPGPAQPAPAAIRAPATWPDSANLEALGLLPRIRWDIPLAAGWRIGEDGAQARLAEFVDGHAAEYNELRDFPGVDGVSRLSPHLHFGEISPRQAWRAIQSAAAAAGLLSVPETMSGWLRQLAWREFAYHLLHHYPHTTDAPLREDFRDFPWCDDPRGLERWQRGETGFPIVDAGMRELWQTGWMHNRVRMIVASFLCKDIGAHWLAGARWFWDTLVDADLPNNTLGWQWTAGCGADAAPYFRVFNPVLQSAKFDPAGVYLRRWLPELARLPTADLHAPWQAGPLSLAAAGVRLGADYPAPMLDHGAARLAALARLKRVSA